jgi:hypothetical protein
MGECGELTGAGGGVSASCSGDEWLNAVAMLEMSLYYNKKAHSERERDEGEGEWGI